MRNRPDSVMVFAAGFGTRMGDLTKTRPKPLIEVSGKTLLDHALDQVLEGNPSNIVVNAHYKSDMIAAHLADRNIHVSIEHPDILDTGGGLRFALPKLGNGPVITSNSDAVWRGPNPVPMLQDAWDPNKMDALLLCVPIEQTVGRSDAGDFTLTEDGIITRGPGHVYSGIQIIKTDGLKEIPETAFSLNILWDKMAQNGRLYGLNYPGYWCDVGHPEGIALAEEMLARHV